MIERGFHFVFDWRGFITIMIMKAFSLCTWIGPASGKIETFVAHHNQPLEYEVSVMCNLSKLIFSEGQEH